MLIRVRVIRAWIEVHRFVENRVTTVHAILLRLIPAIATTLAFMSNSLSLDFTIHVKPSLTYGIIKTKSYFFLGFLGTFVLLI